jgi:hypothetical protein
MATFVIYLQSPSRGGATVFPRAALTNISQPPVGSRAAMDSPGGSAGGAAAVIGVAEGGGGDVLRQLRQQVGGGEGGEGAVGGGGEGTRVPWYCEEGANVLKVAPAAGDALLFWWV